MNSRKPTQLRLPQELKEWIMAESDRNSKSQVSEAIRDIRAARGLLFLFEGSWGLLLRTNMRAAPY